MKNNQIEIENNDIFKNIEFNKNEIKTEENFFNEFDSKDNGEDLSLDFDKSENSLSSDKLDLCDKSMEEQMNKVTLNDEKDLKFSKKITKEELKTIPLPLFECIFCAGEKISFLHYINEIMTKKYLYNLEKKDLILMDFLLNNNILKIKENKKDLLSNFSKKNNINLYRIKSLVDMIVDNTEYINKFYTAQESINYLKQKRNRENNKTIKKTLKKDKINFDTNIDFSEGKYGDNNINIFENDENFDNNVEKEKNKELINDKNNLEKNDDDNDYERFFDENCFWDLSRKIKKEDIIFEDKPYNIWENKIDDSLEKDS